MRIQTAEKTILQTQSTSAPSRTAFVAVASLFLLLGCPPSSKVDAPITHGKLTLAWDESAAIDLAGYIVYYRAADHDSDGTYQHRVDARHPTSPCGQTPPPCYTLTAGIDPGIVAGRTYVFAVATYDRAGNESDYSPELEGVISHGDSVAPPP